MVKTFYCPVLVTRSLPPPLLYQWTLLSEHLSSKTDSDFTLLIPLPPNAHRHTHTHIYTLLGPLGDSAVAGTKLRARWKVNILSFYFIFVFLFFSSSVHCAKYSLHTPYTFLRPLLLPYFYLPRRNKVLKLMKCCSQHRPTCPLFNWASFCFILASV